MANFSFVWLVSALLAMFSLSAFRSLAPNLGLLDTPNERKVHAGQIPLVGGLSAYLGCAVALFLFAPIGPELFLFLLCSGVLVCVGVLDDAWDLPAMFRLGVQVSVGAVLVLGSGQYLADLGDLVGMGPVLLGTTMGVLVSIAAVIGATNAFNMVDGIDGLLGSLSLVTLLALAYLFSASGAHTQELLLTIGIAVALIPYLLANLQVLGRGGKVFFGDAGSMFIGFAVVWLLICATQGQQAVMRPVTALWIIAVPLMDMVAIMIRRARKGQSIMRPDKEHLHHIFLRAGFTQRQTLLVITFVAVLMAAFGLIGEALGVAEWVMFAVFLAVFACYDWSLQRVWRLLRLFRYDLVLSARRLR